MLRKEGWFYRSGVQGNQSMDFDFEMLFCQLITIFSAHILDCPFSPRVKSETLDIWIFSEFCTFLQHLIPNYSEQLHSGQMEKWSIHRDQKVWKLAGCLQVGFTFRQNGVWGHFFLPVCQSIWYPCFIKASASAAAWKFNLLYSRPFRHNSSQLLLVALCLGKS